MSIFSSVKVGDRVTYFDAYERHPKRTGVVTKVHARKGETIGFAAFGQRWRLDGNPAARNGAWHTPCVEPWKPKHSEVIRLSNLVNTIKNHLRIEPIEKLSGEKLEALAVLLGVAR